MENLILCSKFVYNSTSKVRKSFFIFLATETSFQMLWFSIKSHFLVREFANPDELKFAPQTSSTTSISSGNLPRSLSFPPEAEFSSEFFRTRFNLGAFSHVFLFETQRGFWEKYACTYPGIGPESMPYPQETPGNDRLLLRPR